jgi:hypothetical protein
VYGGPDSDRLDGWYGHDLLDGGEDLDSCANGDILFNCP